MFKFFRIYNKFILAVGGSLLMIAFLVGSSLQSLVGPSIPVQGTLDGEDITVMDTRHASNQLEILKRYVPQLYIMTQTMLKAENDYDRSLLWYMIQYDAGRLGIGASNAEAFTVLNVIGIDETGVKRIANQMKQQEGVVLDAVKSWVVAEMYSELVLGKGHESVYARLQKFVGTANAYQQMFGQQVGPQYVYQLAALSSEDPYRVSKPLMEHFLQDQNARVGGEAVVIPADLYLEDVAAPSETDLNTLFEKYKNDLPGKSEPFGFGYKIADRVKLEYISIPIDECLKQVTVEEAEAYEFYKKNEANFVERDEQGQPKEGGSIQPYSAVREQLITEMKRNKAFELGQTIAKTALAELQKPLASVKKVNGYYNLGDDYQGEPMRVVADDIFREFKVRPQQFNAQREKWIEVDRVQELPGIGMSFVGGQQNAPFATYVASAKQLDPSETNPLIALYLQENVPSDIMIGFDGSMFIFRLTAAEAAHAPESIDLVKTQVETDAKLQMAFEKLKDERAQWLDLAKQSGLEAVAKQAKVEVKKTGLVPRVEMRSAAGGDQTPEIAGIGKSQLLVDAMYKTARDTGKNGDLKDIAAMDRMGEADVDSKLALVVFRVDDYNLMTESEYIQNASKFIETAGSMNYTLFLSEEPNVISFEMLSERLKWVPERSDEEDMESADQVSDEAEAA
ncbi:hypothetical protein KS4_26950 [Poriferisphaera corsica]|uniref:Uncharacterized protein n=1 Tax=Poriferisphaera corsica TaxID=2528020 RepID=A0A517YWM3_9BACT|nr:hypothetical protein [Poriferisphaera corsica]QDU34624.1 hypothetical protein KS4_26950 [Poriferisphaera corsica]